MKSMPVFSFTSWVMDLRDQGALKSISCAPYLTVVAPSRAAQSPAFSYENRLVARVLFEPELHRAQLGDAFLQLVRVQRRRNPLADVRHPGAGVLQQALQGRILGLRRFREGAEEKAEIAPRRSPAGELLLIAIEGVHQHHTLDAMGRAAALQRIGRRPVAAAIGHHHDRRGVEMRARAAIAVQAHQPLGRLVDVGREVAGPPEIAGARVGGVERQLRRHQRDVLARLGDLPRQRLTLHDIALEGGALAVQEQHDQARQMCIVAGGQVQQGSAVAVGRLLPEDVAAQGRVAAPLAVARIEEATGRRVDAVVTNTQWPTTEVLSRYEAALIAHGCVVIRDPERSLWRIVRRLSLLDDDQPARRRD